MGPKSFGPPMGACFRLPVFEVTPDGLAGLLKKAELPLYATALGKDTVDIKTGGPEPVRRGDWK